MIAVLLPHTGAHCAQHAPLLACLPPFFRRALRMPWRKPAVPAALPSAGAATPPDGVPVLGTRLLSDVRSTWSAARFKEPADPGAGLARRPVNGRSLGTLPRRTPGATLGRAPWETGSFQVPADVTLVPATPCAGLSFDCGNGLHAPVCDRRNCPCDCHRAPVHGEASQLAVREAQERLARGLTA